MWAHYRKTFVATQILIMIICAALNLHWGIPLKELAIYALIMELFAFVGALWATRLKRKIEAARGMLPTDRC